MWGVALRSILGSLPVLLIVSLITFGLMRLIPGDPAAAIQTIRHALETHEWEVNDAAYFLFRLAELYDEVEGDRYSAVAIMNQVIEQFPGTRHSANASHKLHEWSSADAAAAAAAEEEEYRTRV